MTFCINKHLSLSSSSSSWCHITTDSDNRALPKCSILCVDPMPISEFPVGWLMKIGPKLLKLITNRKSHTPFRLVPKSTTLDDFEWPIRTVLQKRFVLEPTTKN